MKAAVNRYLNEIVSLTVLTLMAVALVAGQADATVHGAGDNLEPIRNIFETRIDGRD